MHDLNTKKNITDYYRDIYAYHLTSKDVQSILDEIISALSFYINLDHLLYKRILLYPYIAFVVTALQSQESFKSEKNYIASGKTNDCSKFIIKVASTTSDYREFFMSSDGAEYVASWLSSLDSRDRDYSYTSLSRSEKRRSPTLIDNLYCITKKIITGLIRPLLLFAIFKGRKIFVKDIYFSKLLLSKILTYKNKLVLNVPKNSLNSTLRSQLVSKLDVSQLSVKNAILMFSLQHIPISLFERFEDSVKQAISVYPKTNYKYALSSYSLTADELYRFWLYSKSFNDNKFQILSYQHGLSGVLDYRYHILQQIEELICDKLFGWGNLSYGGTADQFYSVGVPRQFKYLHKRCKRNHACVYFVFRPIPKNLYWPGWKLIATDIAERASKAELDQCIKPVYKIYLNESQLSQRKIIENASITTPRFDELPGFNRRLRTECELIVFTYFSTGFAEAIAAGLPAMLLISDGHMHTETFYQYSKDLQKAQILHYSVDSLFNAIEKHSCNIQAWHKHQEVQLAVSRFKSGWCQSRNSLLGTMLSISRLL